MIHFINVFLVRIQKAAAEVLAVEDVWADQNIPSIPAECVIRHLYNDVTQTWTTEHTIVKMEREPFTHGAMRFCFRMKKLATPPTSATNHRFHRYGWTRASNYVAKAYIQDGVMDCSELAKDAVRNDIRLQYEANKWAQRFNSAHPPKEINFIRAYAMEFTNREGTPWFAVERFIAGKDAYGAGFHKHNTNSGYIDLEQRRRTPQVFSAYSFYASNGTRLVADIQGVEDLYTDPQVLSDNYQFGDGDLGPRGMALFFHSFRHCTFSDSMGIPIFPLSRNELKHQSKYNDDEVTISDDDEGSMMMDVKLSKLDRININRQRRQSVFITPMDLNQLDEDRATQKRSNLISGDEIRTSFRKSMKTANPPRMNRSQSDVDEITMSLKIATQNTAFDHRAFHRKASGEIRQRSTVATAEKIFRGSVMKIVAPPLIPNSECRVNLGNVHYHLACLHGMGRFPETIPTQITGDFSPDHDVSSVIFHLAHAASLYNVPACLALARVQAGLESSVSSLLMSNISVDFEAAKDLLQRALESPHPPSNPKAAAGCLLYQILQDEDKTTDIHLVGVLEDTLALMETAAKETIILEQHEARIKRGGTLHTGDKVTGNYALEGEFYSGVVLQVADDGKLITVQYDDDASIENLTAQNVKPLIPATATMKTTLLSDTDLFGQENSDEICFLEEYVLTGDLAELKVKLGEMQLASKLFEAAAEGAMNAGKIQTATKWSLRAAELLA